MQTRFEWDAAKEKVNLTKHRVSFKTAAQAFTDPFALVEQDRIENGEYRWQTIGLIGGYLLLLVAHTVQEDEDDTEVIRIISARRADPKERKRYEQNRAL